MWQATTKAAELIKLVTYYNNANTVLINHAHTHVHTHTHKIKKY